MGLAWELHELIQDFVDGKLTPKREIEVQAFLDKHPNAQLLADQYRVITQPDFAPQSTLDTSSNTFVDNVMRALPTEPWYAFFTKRDFLTSFAVMAVSIALWYFADFEVIANWLQVKVVSNITAVGLIDDSILAMFARLDGLIPVLGASVLIASFYGILDQVMALGHKAKRI